MHALAGGNGAGKSTLMKILQGVYTPDQGEILIDGKPATSPSIHGARAAGIGMVFQEFSLVPTLTVAQNIYLDHGTPGRWSTDQRPGGPQAGRRGLHGDGVDIEPRARRWAA